LKFAIPEDLAKPPRLRGGLDTAATAVVTVETAAREQ